MKSLLWYHHKIYHKKHVLVKSSYKFFIWCTVKWIRSNTDIVYSAVPTATRKRYRSLNFYFDSGKSAKCFCGSMTSQKERIRWQAHITSHKAITITFFVMFSCCAIRLDWCWPSNGCIYEGIKNLFSFIDWNWLVVWFWLISLLPCNAVPVYLITIWHTRKQK